MNYKILRNKINYKKEVQALGDFLISNRIFFNIFVEAINHSKSNIIGYIKTRYVAGKIVNEFQFHQFEELMKAFLFSVKLKKSREGDLLEYLITKVKKPLKLQFDKLGYESSCKIYEARGIGNICNNNCDLDVVLYNLEKVDIDSYFIYFDNDVEFLECKQDVNTFLYLNDKNEIDKEDTLKKLEMFKSIKRLMGKKNDVKYMFISFVKPTRIHINYLKRNGYSFIEIVDGRKINGDLFY